MLRLLAAGVGALLVVAGGTRAWVAQYRFKPGLNASSVAMAASADGKRIYVLEGSDDSVMLGGARVADYVAVAYNASTGAKLWVAPYRPSTGSNHAYGIAVSPDGSRVYVTGDSARGDAATVAYRAASGARLWVAVSSGVHSHSMAVSPDGTKVYVLGYGGKASGAPLVVLAYAARNGAKAWAAEYREPKGDGVFPEALTPSGNGTVYVAATGSNDVASWDVTLAYDPVSGARLWRAVCKAGNGPAGIAVDPQGARVYVTGGGYGVDARGVTVAYNAVTGSQLWVARYHDPHSRSGRDTAEAIAVNANGTHLFVSGQNGSGSADLTVAYNAKTGAQLWAASYHDGVAVNALASSPDGTKLFLAGTRLPDDSFGLTLAYDATTGRELWATRYAGTADAMAVGGTEVYVTGAVRVSGSGRAKKTYECVTIAYHAGRSG